MTPKALIPPEQVYEQPVKNKRSLFLVVGIFLFEMFTVYQHDEKRSIIKA